MALVTDVHSMVLKSILNNFLLLFFKVIYLNNQTASSVKNSVIGNGISQN